jgi:piezo-type mechanosensitive ion channel component 1/2
MLQIFAAVPFVYELREILDWSATPTTLRLYDWLKLEVGQSVARHE